MKIAIVGPIESAMSTKSVGGTETWTYGFAEYLVKKGHEVTLFGAEGTEFSGQFVPICSHQEIADSTGALAKQRFAVFSIEEMLALISKINEFDLVHVSYYSFHYFLPFSNLIKKPIVETIHGSPMTYADMEILFKKYQKPYFIFPTKSSANRWPTPHRSRIINHGIKLEDFPFTKNKKRNYFFWMGRIVEQKGIVEAIKFAKTTDSNLIIAGPKNELSYFDQNVKPYLNKKIQYVGELGPDDKVKYLQDAQAFLMPIVWEEPFGLVMVEAMACGTPVVAYGYGSVPELIKDGQTGFVCRPKDFECFKKSAQKIEALDAQEYAKMSLACRAHVEQNFNFERMVAEYEEVYQKAVKEYR